MKTTLSLASLTVLCLSCTSPSDTSLSDTCHDDPIAQGLVVAIDPNVGRACDHALNSTKIISDQETWGVVVADCFRYSTPERPTVYGPPPEIDFRTHEVLLLTDVVWCPLNITLDAHQCEDGILTAYMSYEPDWCLCDAPTSAPFAYIAPRDYITEIVGTRGQRGLCEDVSCTCRIDEPAVDGCTGCSLY